MARSVILSTCANRPVSRRRRHRAGVASAAWGNFDSRADARYTDATGKQRAIGYFDTQEDAAHAVNAAIRRAGLGGRRKTNPVVDGRLVPRKTTYKRRGGKRRREEPAATPPPRARCPRSAVNDVSEPDADDDEDLELAPPDDEDGWD